jgi:hypothetical protein
LRFFAKSRKLPPQAPGFPQKYPTLNTTLWFAHHETRPDRSKTVAAPPHEISKMLISPRPRRPTIRTTT